MPMVENPDGTLRIDIHSTSEVDAIRRRLTDLGVSVTALAPDPACKVTAEDVAWADVYPKIVLRNGPEPGLIVQPAAIPPGHTLLLAANRMAGAPRGREVVIVLSMIRGPAPLCYGKVITRARAPGDPRLRPAGRPGERPVKPRFGPAAPRLGSAECSQLMLRVEQADEETQRQLWVLNEHLPDPLRVESRSWEFWVSYPAELSGVDVRDQVRSAISEAGLHLLAAADGP